MGFGFGQLSIAAHDSVHQCFCSWWPKTFHIENRNDQIVHSLLSMINDFGFEDCTQGQPTHRYNGSMVPLWCSRGSPDYFALFSTISLKSLHKPAKAKAPTRFYEFRDLKQLANQNFFMIMSYLRLGSSLLSQFSVIQLMRLLPC